MTVSNPVKFGLILLLIILIVILGILTELISLPKEVVTVTTTTTVTPTTTLLTTTIPPTTIIITTTTVPTIMKRSYCEDHKCWLFEGQSIQVEEENVTYMITLLGVIDDDTAVLGIDGESKTFHEGEDKTVKGLGIYLMEIFYLPKKEQVSFVHLLYY
ncbi:MAG: hypothetical protein QMD36_00370 [Candidatus Aenigmarchaeota archaeon]|nr:hypothetical protein [Candidatus Aenigmarchaeota archaeon]